ncbi:MAG TPA: SLBB domain-containing protein [Candidatus Methylomirabilis sp.]|nr:SLBB domain-containing protein [Candidatus Methylomirabilis sp.]
MRAKWFRHVGGSRGIRPWLAGLLAVLTAIPAPAIAQVSPGTQSPFSSPFSVPGTPGSPEQRSVPSTPRTMRELFTFPVIMIIEPRNGAIITRDDPSVVITYADPRNELDLSSLRIFVNGVDRTREFQATQGGATWRPDLRRAADSIQGTGQSGQDRQSVLEGLGLLRGLRSDAVTRGSATSDQQAVLEEGQNTIIASIKNLSGNLATVSSAFILDRSTLLATRAVPRSPLERAFLQPPTPPPSETVQRAAPTGPVISRDLTQFGYDMFGSLLPSLTPATNLPVSPDYQLGPGDGLILYFWNIPGAGLYDSVPLLVDRSGSVFVPRVGSVPLQGLTLAQAQEVIRSRVGRYYSGFELRLTLGELRGISVYVVGEVARPGTYTISPFSTLLDALIAAGGPTKMGTLRTIRLVRNGKTQEEVDLYDFLLRGERSLGPTLQAGDTVFAPPVGAVAGVTGEVKRPGIYEIRAGTTVGALVAMAGGPLPTAQLDRIQVERQAGGAGKLILDLAFAPTRGAGASELVRDGDLVTIFPGEDRLRNAVMVEGFVRTPGQYEWKPGMHVSDLLQLDALLPEAYLNRVEVVRMRPDFSREILDVDLRKLWASAPTPDPSQDLPLQPMDRISVKSEVVGPETVTISGQVRRPGAYAITKGERLSGLLDRAGGYLPEAFPRGAVFTRESIRQLERQQIEKFVRTQEQTLLAETAALAGGSVSTGAPAEVGTLAAINALRRDLVRSLTSVLTVGRLSIRLAEPEKLKGTPDDILLEAGDSLVVPQTPTSVLVIGAVRNSTSILHKPGENTEYYISQAGGPRPEAAAKETYILKADGSAIASFVNMRNLEPGDAVIVPISTEGKIQWVPFLKDMLTIVAQAFIPIGVIGGLLK